MKSKLKIISLVVLSTCALAACGGGAASSEIPTSGSTPAASSVDPKGKSTVTLWCWGDQDEINVFTDLLRTYNNTNKDNIYVNLVKKPSGSYYSTLETALTGRQSPDLFYVGDSMIKRYANAGYLEDLSSYISQSKELDTTDIWPTLMDRYQFDPYTYLHGEDAPIWGLPKDLGPTVCFYNEDALKAQGITVISAKDDDKDGKVIYQDKEYDARGYDPDNKVFNNKISMTTEELGELAKLCNHKSSMPSKHQTQWTFYSSWWFYIGWSVGGDCIQFRESDDPAYNGGFYEFVLDDKKPNYRVLKDVTLNGHEYKANSFVDFWDLEFMTTFTGKQELIENGTLVELPSINEAFEYWISNFHNGTSPKPEDISTELSLFTNEQVALFVTGRYNTITFRKDCKFNWDVAPLPRHADGVDAGHSGSMCLSMSKKCKDKNNSFKVFEYLTGKTGQEALTKTGFSVPSQMSLARDPNAAFLSSKERPYNNEIFLDAAVYQKGGDWTYLKDDAWINIWAPTLNGDVLNGIQTTTQLFAKYKTKVNDALKEYTKAR